jgi:hypothetical protein
LLTGKSAEETSHGEAVGALRFSCNGRKRRGTAKVLLRCDVRQRVAVVNINETKTCANALIQINLD